MKFINKIRNEQKERALDCTSFIKILEIKVDVGCV